MANFEAKQRAIAERYGHVLFELAQEDKTLKTVLKDVACLRQYFKDEPLEWAKITSPVISLQTQQRIVEVLTASFKLGNLMNRFLNVLCQNRRLQNLSAILEDFLAQEQAAAGIMEGILETAVELSKKEIEALQMVLECQLGKEITLHQKVKESLLGGIVLRLGSFMIDASIGTQLNKLRQVMKG